jgi:hypothetical protein
MRTTMDGSHAGNGSLAVCRRRVSKGTRSVVTEGGPSPREGLVGLPTKVFNAVGKRTWDTSPAGNPAGGGMR